MALTRRSTQRVTGSIWPGFVDAMTALLLVLMFVLTIFMIVQFMLRETISTQDTELDQLSLQVADLAAALGLEQQKSFQLEEEVTTLSADLGESRSLTEVQAQAIATLTNQARAQTARVAAFEEQVASLLAGQQDARARIAALMGQNSDAQDRISGLLTLNDDAQAQIETLQGRNADTTRRLDELQQRNADLDTEKQGLFAKIEDIEAANARLVTEQEAMNLALAKARDEIDASAEQARLAAARREALEAMIAKLNTEASEQETSMQQLLARLDAATDTSDALDTRLQEARTELTEAEQTRLAEAAAAEELRRRLADTQTRLSDEEAARLTEAAAAEELRNRLDSTNEQLTAMTLALDEARGRIDAQEAEARLATARRDALEAMIAEMRQSAQDTQLSMRDVLAQLETSRQGSDTLGQQVDDLTGRIAQLQSDLSAQTDARQQAEATTALARDELASLQEELSDTRTRLSSLDQALTQEESARLAQIAETEALRRKLAQTQDGLTEAEKARLAEAAAVEALRKRLADVETAFTDEEAARLAEAAAAERLRARLEQADTELSAMTLKLEQERARAEETLSLLAAARTASADLDQQLAAALAAQTDLSQQVATLTDETGREQDELARLRAENEALRASLDDNQETLEKRLASALAARLAAEQTAARRLTQAEERALLLQQARSELADEKAAGADARNRLELLNRQTAQLRSELASLQALLDDAQSRDEANEVQIQALGSKLNLALAQTAAEQKRRAELEAAERKRLEAEALQLEKFRSDFFGRLREVLDNVDGVRIEGDRFVFSSEVLFRSGQAELSSSGRAEIAKVADILKSVADRIPDSIDWIIRVDGHTDNVPLSGFARFANNWELSQARALSVVLYMNQQLGIPADRLAATGFGEYQPVNTADTPEARAQNRRIELKLTER